MRNAFYSTLKALFGQQCCTSHALIKVGLSTSQKNCFNKTPLKWWKMLFIPPSKLFSLSRYLNFCLDFLEKTTFMTSQPDQQTITIHILPDISRSKGDQTMKFGQFIECD